MKVTGCNSNTIARMKSYQTRPKSPRASKEKPESGADSVSLSSDAKELVSSMSRSTQLEKIKNDLAQGTYRIDMGAVAQNLLNTELEVDFTGLDHTITTGGGDHA